MNRYGRIVLLLALVPSMSSAHGEQALLLPIGQVFALLVVVIFAFILKMSLAWRVAFVLVPIAGSVGCWYIPNLYFIFLDWFGTSGFPWFMLGLLAPIGLAFAVFLLALGTEKK